MESASLLHVLVPALGEQPSLLHEAALWRPLGHSLQLDLIHSLSLLSLFIPDQHILLDEPHVQELPQQLHIEVVIAVLYPGFSSLQLLREEAHLSPGHREVSASLHATDQESGRGESVLPIAEEEFQDPPAVHRPFVPVELDALSNHALELPPRLWRYSF